MTLLDDPGVGVDAPLDDDQPWTDVCALDDLMPERGAAALVGGEAVAIFRFLGDELYACGNLDPFSGASVLSRGIVGSVGDRPVVASPVFKQRFDLQTGVALEDPTVSVPVYEVVVRAGRVLVRGPRRTAPPA